MDNYQIELIKGKWLIQRFSFRSNEVKGWLCVFVLNQSGLNTNERMNIAIPI